MASPQEMKRIQIQTLHNQGMGIREIARQLKCNRETVRKWQNRDDHRKTHGGGPKLKLTPKTKAMIDIEMRDKLGASTRKCVNTLNFSDRFQVNSKSIS